jgi:competence protein ComEC
LIPVGYRNRFGHPKADVVERHAAGARIWRTDRDGALRVFMASDALTVAAWREQRQRYWQARREVD